MKILIDKEFLSDALKVSDNSEIERENFVSIASIRKR